MTGRAGIGRRRALFLLASAVLLVPGLAGLGSVALGWARRTRERFACELGATGSAIAVGAAYLDAVPAEADAAGLERALREELPGLRTPAGAFSALPEPERAAIRAAIRRDFAKGRVVELQGWMLSRTEARLCALASLRAAS